MQTQNIKKENREQIYISENTGIKIKTILWQKNIKQKNIALDTKLSENTVSLCFRGLRKFPDRLVDWVEKNLKIDISADL